MKAAVYSENGGPEVFSYEEVENPIPKHNEVLIKVEAISIEGGDLSNRKLVSPPSPKHIVGYAAAGEIIEMGAEVTGFQKGQKVITFTWAGSHAELRAVAAATTFALPDGIDLQLAIAAFIGVGTAALAIHLSDVQPDDVVLVTGATGGVGNAVVQLLANDGIKVFASGRDAKTLQSLKEFGVAETILAGDKPIHEQVRALKKEGVNVVIDTVGLETLVDGLKAVKDGGKVVLIAGRSGAANFIDPVYLVAHRITIIGCLLGAVMQEPFVRDLLKSSLKQVAEGKIKVPIHQVFRLAEVKDAHTAAEQTGKLGRIIMVP